MEGTLFAGLIGIAVLIGGAFLVGWTAIGLAKLAVRCAVAIAAVHSQKGV